MEFKMVILVRQDLKLTKGKFAVQAAHAAVECSLKSEKGVLSSWLNEGGKKVVLKVSGRDELLSYKALSDQAGIKNALISDAGKTEIPPGTLTCLGMGPEEEEKIDEITKDLKMF